MPDEQTQQPDREEGAHERLNDLHARISDAEQWLKALQGRVQTIERALSREVGPALDIVETAAGFVAKEVGGPVGAVAGVVKKVADVRRRLQKAQPARLRGVQPRLGTAIRAARHAG
jgi:hypothetical protein